MANSSELLCIFILLGLTILIVTPMSIVVIVNYEMVRNLPVGTCFMAGARGVVMIGTISSSVVFEDVTFVLDTGNANETTSLVYPPPPTALNLKRQADVDCFVASVISANKFRCFVDIADNKAYREPIEIGGWAFACALCCLLIILLGITLICVIKKA